ncbi:MoxR family ATPase [Methylomonas sp. AM2-LC]|uniref:AAA family ATPase n=1 Tax=Methylomonas sp. AM2-LC TaxID=3153301 RepID=UPI003266E2BD
MIDRQKIIADIEKLQNISEQTLPANGSWPQSVHKFDEDSLDALRTALAAGRPLLLRGEPGTGKSQLARAVAYALDRLFVYQVIDAHTESQDLLWRFDAVARLAEAQTLQGQQLDTVDRKKLLDCKKFISPGVIWWALDWKTAEDTYDKSQYQLIKPERPNAEWQPGQGSVLLIDEIDKANLELPNGLLEILGNNAVTIPWLDTPIGGGEHLPPLVIITTNEERELPAAFVRRCLVLHLDLPKEDDAFINLMIDRAQLHFKEACSEDIYRSAAKLLLRERERARDKSLTHLPGQAEYLDMLRAIVVLGKNDPQQHVAMLNTISKYTMRKYPQMLTD